MTQPNGAPLPQEPEVTSPEQRDVEISWGGDTVHNEPFPGTGNSAAERSLGRFLKGIAPKILGEELEYEPSINDLMRGGVNETPDITVEHLRRALPDHWHSPQLADYSKPTGWINGALEGLSGFATQGYKPALSDEQLGATVHIPEPDNYDWMSQHYTPPEVIAQRAANKALADQVKGSSEATYDDDLPKALETLGGKSEAPTSNYLILTVDQQTITPQNIGGYVEEFREATEPSAETL